LREDLEQGDRPRSTPLRGDLEQGDRPRSTSLRGQDQLEAGPLAAHGIKLDVREA
jgi:hypothetical protein